MCEVLPTIPESSPSPDGENTKLEQLMISMLEERDKLMEKLRESQERYSEATRRLSEVEADNGILMRQLQAFMPEDKEELHQLLDELRHSGGGLSNGHGEDLNKWPIAKRYASLVRELAAAREKAEEKEEEVMELKSERNNTRLLLEHLECLVARHEKSLRMTVVKKQTAHQAGMSSEVEVLKALKSLFDHHKALDEKVRERLRVAQEKNMFLDEELKLANQEVRALQEENKRIKKSQNRNSVLFSKSYDMGGFTREQLTLLEDRDQTISDLQFSLDERAAELEETVHERDELSGRVQECEEELSMALKELQREQASVKIITMQNNELVSARSELEFCLSEIQAELSACQQECREVKERAANAEDQLVSLNTRTAKLGEEVESLQSELNTRDHALQSAQAHSSEQQRLLSEQLQQVAKRRGSDEVTIECLESQLKASEDEITVKEAQVTRLQSTVERMLKESDAHVKTHLTQRKLLTDEKTRYRELAEHRQRDLAAAAKETEQLREELGAVKLHLRLVETKSSPSLTRTNKRYSWQLSVEPTSSSSPPTHTPPSSTSHIPTSFSSSALADRQKLERVLEEEEVGGAVSGEGELMRVGSRDMSELELGDLTSEDAVEKLMRTLEGQVSLLDKKLEKMGDHQRLAEADEFDQMIQRMSEGSYSSSGLESMPRSSPPGSRLSRKYKPEVLPSTIYRVAPPPSPPPPLPPTTLSPLPPLPSGTASPTNSSSSGSNDSANNSTSSKKSRRSSLSKLFSRKNKRRSGGHKHGFKRFSEPLPRPARRFSDPQLRDSVDIGELLEREEDREEDRCRKSDLLTTVLQRGLHFSNWDTSTLVAWLEVWVGVPYWYIAAIRNCIGNGAVLASLTEAELEQEFGITNTLHRMKLRLAVQEMVSLTSSTTPHLARTTSLYGEMGHEWIGDYWLPSLGLPHYKEVFKVCLVDARMLEYLTKKDLRTALKMLDSSHRNSLQYGISVLKKLDYKKEELERRRRAVNVKSKKDVLVWSNDHIQQWVREIGLGDHAHCLNETGVHGGVVALDNDLDHEKLALALQVPLSSFEVRKHLKTEFEALLREGTNRVSSEPQSHGKIVRKLSKRLKVGTRKVTPPASEFLPVRPSSPVLFPSNPLPSHFFPLLEEATDCQSSDPDELTL